MGPDSSEASERSATSNGTDTPRGSLNQGSQTAGSTMRQSGMTYPLSTVDLFSAWLMSLVAGSHVRTYPLPQDQQGLNAKESGGGAAVFGSSMPESWAKYDPDSSSWKMSQGCLLTGLSESFLGTWPTWGTMHNGSVYQPQQLEPRIPEKEFGLLPTPAASDWQDRSRPGVMAKLYERTGEDRYGGRVIRAICSIGLKLNLLDPTMVVMVSPRLYEWLMGWPSRWSELNSVETELYRSKASRRGKK